MPTVLRVAGFAIRIYHAPREHGPAHVHVVKGEAEVVIELADGGRPQRVRTVMGMRMADVFAADQIVKDHAEELLAYWRRLHG